MPDTKPTTTGAVALAYLHSPDCGRMTIMGDEQVWTPEHIAAEADLTALIDSAGAAQATIAELVAALDETLRALESHLDESCRDHNLKHRSDLCPCDGNEVVRARVALARAREVAK